LKRRAAVRRQLRQAVGAAEAGAGLRPAADDDFIAPVGIRLQVDAERGAAHRCQNAKLPDLLKT